LNPGNILYFDGPRIERIGFSVIREKIITIDIESLKAERTQIRDKIVRLVAEEKEITGKIEAKTQVLMAEREKTRLQERRLQEALRDKEDKRRQKERAQRERERTERRKSHPSWLHF
jgi:hypothetical protein